MSDHGIDVEQFLHEALERIRAIVAETHTRPGRRIDRIARELRRAGYGSLFVDGDRIVDARDSSRDERESPGRANE